MSNYYDLETDLGVEDVAAGEEYEEYEEYENYEDASEFGNYNPEEADAKWGEMDFDQLVVEMESIVSRSKRYFFSKTKRVVNGEDLAQLAQHIQNKLPSEIIAAKDIITRQVAIIDDANTQKANIIAGARQEEADTVNRAKEYYSKTVKKAQDDAAGIVARANEQATAMVHESNIYKLAKEEEARIHQEAEQYAHELLEKTKQECEELRAQAKAYAISVTEGAHNFITNSLAGYQRIAMSNLDTINTVNNQFQGEYAAQVQALGIVRQPQQDI
jgi:uncharacterized protein YeaO (DUF488 family)